MPILTTELRGTLVADRKPHLGCTCLVCYHASAGLVEPDILLILKQGYGAHGFKAFVKNGYAHACQCCDCLEIEAFDAVHDVSRFDRLGPYRRVTLGPASIP